jgi:hypothetical protein
MLPQILNQVTISDFLSPWVIAPLLFLLAIFILLVSKKSILAPVRGYVAQRACLAWAESLIEALSPALTIAILAAGVALLDRTLSHSPPDLIGCLKSQWPARSSWRSSFLLTASPESCLTAWH